ncbi:ABC transporter ATP-binding protein [Arthrobacter castelli]|uniref:ABC transporter ATP-binding protein n=1 Tax=Arthrobacter castelli TaxID=271431 RepID=UPI000402F0E3|nr:ATP-binding cassette domain-containing protein [Arthrobacter castelli]
MSIIEIENMSKAFKGITLFENVSMSFKPGQIYGIVGHNGSGKSVLFKLICGFLKPDAGQIYIDPQFMSGNRTFPENFGVIIDRPGYLPNRTGLENLRELARIRGVIGDREIIESMERVGLAPGTRQKMRNYSLGMKQKLALAQAIMEQPQALLLDEPFNALDVDSVERVRALLLEYRRQGRTVIFTSHNHTDMDLLADQTYRIRAENLEPVA